MNWQDHIDGIRYRLRALSVLDDSGHEISPDIAFHRWRDLTLRLREQKHCVYLIGNGASASMASHMAADLAKNARLHTEVFSDLSLITALANDLGYEEVFAEPLRRRMAPADMLVAISTSGKSSNIIRAVSEAATLGGFVVTLSAKKPDNQLRSLGMLNFYVPAETYGTAESCHAAILHYWMDIVAADGISEIELKHDGVFAVTGITH